LFDIVAQSVFVRIGEIFDFYVLGYFANTSEQVVFVLKLRAA
jgi:hypothetical protein